MTDEPRDPELLAMFLLEARERLESFNQGVLILERETNAGETINALFREMHTIKGGARYLAFTPLDRLCHQTENALNRIREDQTGVNQALIGLLLRVGDHIEVLLGVLETTPEAANDDRTCEGALGVLMVQLAGFSGATVGRINPRILVPAVVDNALSEVLEAQHRIIQDAIPGFNDPASVATAQAAITLAAQTILQACVYEGNTVAQALAIYVVDQAAALGLSSVDGNWDALALRTGLHELMTEVACPARSVPSTGLPAIHLSNVPEAGTTLPPPSPPESVTPAQGNGSRNRSDRNDYISGTLRIDEKRVNHTLTLAEELTIARTALRQAILEVQRDPVGGMRPLLAAASAVDRISELIQVHALSLRRVAIKAGFLKFTRVVRDLTIALKKDIELIVEGEDLEVDKTIVDAIGDPLVHMLRNSCDHGLEGPDERKATGKPSHCTIRVTAFSEGKQVIITLADDGRGIDVNRVVEKAVAQGLIQRERVEVMAHEERLALIFLPGLSTANAVTDVSGRGVGMDVVKKAVDQLGGQISIASQPGIGTSFRIALPINLSITSCLLVEIAGMQFGLPIEALRETRKIPLAGITRLGHQPVVSVRGDIVPLHSLSRLMDLPGVDADLARHLDHDTGDGLLPVVILHHGNALLGLVVDRLVGQQSLVVKPLPEFLAGALGVSGASIRANGTILLLLDPAQLQVLAQEHAGGSAPGRR